MSILCVGEMVADIVVRPVLADVQQRDSTIVEEISVVNGGDALNTAVGLGRLGHDVAFIGKAGKMILAVCWWISRGMRESTCPM